MIGTLVVKGLTPAITIRDTKTNIEPSQMSMMGLSKYHYLFSK